ncbi:hypothetical protein [Citreimonas salinaria]|uniref:Type II and III secretion system protein n=1 Tax=Citreimonas salinaria TaxID=321339 RepID=A0A1H3LYK8_9RHOB|nr:hypothetical protein [Citreimonas salinaria]SDY69521.1 type II and III secretion system protein [Citreimonas salinaria]
MKRIALNLFLAATVAVAACSPMDRKQVTTLPENGSVAARSGTQIQPQPRAAITTRNVSQPVMRDLEQVSSNRLPDVLVGPFAAAEMPLVDVMDAVSYDSGVAFSYGGDDLEGRTLSFVDPSKMPLEDAVKRIARAGDLYWSYVGGVLELQSERAYSVSVPGVSGAADSLAAAVAGVGATEVTVSEASGGIIFSASPSVARRVEGVIKNWSGTRQMIDYEAYIWEVDRSMSHSSGTTIQTLKNKLSAVATAEIQGNGLVVKSEAADLVIDMLISSIDESSSSRVLSQPTLSVVSGGKAEIDVGNKQKYVERLATTTEDGVLVSEVTIGEINSGITMSISGEYSSEVIVTDLELTLSTLIGFEEFDTGSAKMKLPETAERKVSQTLLARPGDTLVLAGVMSSAVEQAETGTRGRKTSASARTSMTELIVVLRPRVTQYR